ncbi:hypothetical protein [Clostridium tarantellae]|uniref:hypothetical protein n=1 Tax=Clostridium tarantellae TaxID=39493 RepID=UPI001479595F|nr:hypothetical protein [Clostridium tarantellae]
MNKKKVMSIILASSIISATIIGRNITVKATTPIKSKEVHNNKSEKDVKTMRRLIITYLDRLENYLNNKDYKYIDELFKRIEFSMSKYKQVANIDEEMQKKFDLLKPRYEKTAEDIKTAKNLKARIKSLLGTARESLTYEVYDNIPELVNFIEEAMNELKQYEEVPKYNIAQLNDIKTAFKNKDKLAEEVKKSISKPEKRQEELKQQTENKDIKKIEENIKNNEINKKNNEINKKNNEDYRKNEKLQKKDEKNRTFPLEVKEIKAETNTLINNLNNEVKTNKDKVKINNTLNSVENKIEELKKYKKVETIESTFNEIKNDIKSGKEIDSAKLMELKEQLDKSISDENNENLEEQINKDIESEAKDLLNNNNLEASNKDLLEKESNKSLAVKVGVGIGTMLLGVSAFFINKKVRRKKH